MCCAIYPLPRSTRSKLSVNCIRRGCAEVKRHRKALLTHDTLAPSAHYKGGDRVRFAETWREEFLAHNGAQAAAENCEVGVAPTKSFSNSVEVPESGRPPSSPSRALSKGWARPALTFLLSRSTISSGVCLGAQMPNQTLAWYRQEFAHGREFRKHLRRPRDAAKPGNT
jgi:hypothetical protein